MIDLNAPALLLGNREQIYDADPEFEIDETEAAARKIAALDLDVKPSDYREAKARLERLEALVTLRTVSLRAQQIKPPPTGDQKLRELKRVRDAARDAAAYALASCRALGIDPEPPTTLSLLAEIREAVRDVASR